MFHLESTIPIQGRRRHVPQVNLSPPERASEVLTAQAFNVAAGVIDWIVIELEISAVIVGVPGCIKVDTVVFTVPSPEVQRRRLWSTSYFQGCSRWNPEKMQSQRLRVCRVRWTRRYPRPHVEDRTQTIWNKRVGSAVSRLRYGLQWYVRDNY